MNYQISSWISLHHGRGEGQETLHEGNKREFSSSLSNILCFPGGKGSDALYRKCVCKLETFRWWFELFKRRFLCWDITWKRSNMPFCEGESLHVLNIIISFNFLFIAGPSNEQKHEAGSFWNNSRRLLFVPKRIFHLQLCSWFIQECYWTRRRRCKQAGAELCQAQVRLS